MAPSENNLRTICSKDFLGIGPGIGHSIATSYKYFLLEKKLLYIISCRKIYIYHLRFYHFVL